MTVVKVVCFNAIAVQRMNFVIAHLRSRRRKLRVLGEQEKTGEDTENEFWVNRK